jgi:hypothetical protein
MQKSLKRHDIPTGFGCVVHGECWLRVGLDASVPGRRANVASPTAPNAVRGWWAWRQAIHVPIVRSAALVAGFQFSKIMRASGVGGSGRVVAPRNPATLAIASSSLVV